MSFHLGMKEQLYKIVISSNTGDIQHIYMYEVPRVELWHISILHKHFFNKTKSWNTWNTELMSPVFPKSFDLKLIWWLGYFGWKSQMGSRRKFYWKANSGKWTYRSEERPKSWFGMGLRKIQKLQLPSLEWMRALAIVSLFTKLTHIQIPEREHMMNLISCVLNLLTRLLD